MRNPFSFLGLIVISEQAFNTQGYIADPRLDMNPSYLPAYHLRVLVPCRFVCHDRGLHDHVVSTAGLGRRHSSLGHTRGHGQTHGRAGGPGWSSRDGPKGSCRCLCMTCSEAASRFRPSSCSRGSSGKSIASESAVCCTSPC